jgi:2-haloacid dehalogenase
MKRHKDFWQVTEDSLDKSMKAYDIDSSMRKELLGLYKILSTFEEVPEVLKSLKEKNYKLAILSNGTPNLLNEVVFLSANTWDVSGGGNYGYNSIWVNRNNNIFDNLDYEPKHQIEDLSKLLDII